MKITKLLFCTPVVSLTALPFAISACGANYVEPLEMVDLFNMEEYVPSFQTLKEKDKSITEIDYFDAADYYVEEMSKNPSHFQEDQLYLLSIMVKNDFTNALTSDFLPTEERMELTAAEVGISKPVFGTTKIWERGFKDLEIDTISFTKKIHLTYVNNSLDNTNIVRNLVCEMTYNNVVFGGYEHFKNNELPGDSDGWATGILDETVEEEAFWVHNYNTNPWSISYSCTDQQVKTIHGEEGTPDIEVHKSEYYSGYIDNSESLYDLWVFRNREFSSGLEKERAKLENTLIDSLLMRRNRSYYLKGIENKPDVCIVDPLYVYGFHTAAEDQPVNIRGINIINSFNDRADISSVKLLTTTPIVATYTEGSDVNTITIAPGAAITKSSDRTYWYIPGIIKHQYPQIGSRSSYPFTINVQSLPVEIKYSYPGGEVMTSKTVLNLHYNSISLIYVV